MKIVIFVHKHNSRKEYIFKHVFKRILEWPYELTTDLSTFISHDGPKFSYGTKPIGDEFFIWSHGLLDDIGIEDYDIEVIRNDKWPLFFKAPVISDLSFDVFAASFYLITRFEEYLPQVKDHLDDLVQMVV